jgi:hypothetical protein
MGGGDKVLPDLRGTYRFNTPTDLTSYIVGRQNMFELDKIEEITSVTGRELRESDQRCLRSYPERSLDHQYLHFQIHERGMG